MITLPLVASSIWIKAQAFSSHSNKTTTYSLGNVTLEEKSTATLAGLNAGLSLYPGDSSFGLGLQLGAGKMLSATNGSSDEDVSGYPLTWNSGVTAYIVWAYPMLLT